MLNELKSKSAIMCNNMNSLIFIYWWRWRKATFVHTEGRAVLRLWWSTMSCSLGLVQAPPAGPGWLAGPSVPFHVHVADSPREGRLGAPALGVHAAEEAGRGLLWRGVGRAVEEHGARGHQDH